MISVSDINRTNTGNTRSKRRNLAGSRSAVTEADAVDSSQGRLSAGQQENQQTEQNNKAADDAENNPKSASYESPEPAEKSLSSIEAATYDSSGYKRRCFRIDIKA